MKKIIVSVVATLATLCVAAPAFAEETITAINGPAGVSTATPVADPNWNQCYVTNPLTGEGTTKSTIQQCFVTAAKIDAPAVATAPARRLSHKVCNGFMRVPATRHRKVWKRNCWFQ